MPCLVPFNSKDLDITMFVLRPTGVFPEYLIESLKYFSFYVEDLGCFYSSIMTSIHGSMVVWYGAWAKRSEENREALYNTLRSSVRSLSGMAELIDFSFHVAESGESKDGSRSARLSTGDTVSLMGMEAISDNCAEELSYACLALLKSSLTIENGITAGVSFRCVEKRLVAVLYVWDSLTSCYSWLLADGYRSSTLPYISHLTRNVDYDIFRVVFVSTDDVVDVSFLSPATTQDGAHHSGASSPQIDADDAAAPRQAERRQRDER